MITNRNDNSSEQSNILDEKISVLNETYEATKIFQDKFYHHLVLSKEDEHEALDLIKLDKHLGRVKDLIESLKKIRNEAMQNKKYSDPYHTRVSKSHIHQARMLYAKYQYDRLFESEDENENENERKNKNNRKLNGIIQAAENGLNCLVRLKESDDVDVNVIF